MHETPSRWRRLTATATAPLVALTMFLLVGVSPAHAATTTTETIANTGGGASGSWQFPTNTDPGGRNSGLDTLASSSGTDEGFAFEVGDSAEATVRWDLNSIIDAGDAVENPYATVTDSSISLVGIDSKVWVMDARAFDETGEAVAPADIETEFSSAGATDGDVTYSATDNGDGTLRISIEDSRTANDDGSTDHDTTVRFSVADGLIGDLELVSFQDLTWSTDQVQLTADRVVTTAEGPTAAPDTSTTDQGVPITVPLLANDTAGDAPIHAPSTALLSSSGNPTDSLELANQGTLTVDNAGTVEFVPDPDYFGDVDASYRITDENGMTSESTLTITITPAADSYPIANSDHATTPPFTPVTLRVLENDIAGDDAAIDPAQTVLLDDAGTPVDTLLVPNVGTFTVDDEGQVRFEPVRTFTGASTGGIPYRITDEAGRTDRSTLGVNVEPRPPEAVPDSATTTQGTPVSFNVLDNDRSWDFAIETPFTRFVEGTGSTGRNLTLPGVGTFELDWEGEVTFEPEPGFTGRTPAVEYQIIDEAQLTDVSTIVVTVTPSEPPAGEATDDAASTPAGTPVTIDPTGNDKPGDPDVPLDPATVRLIDPASGEPVTKVSLDAGTFVVGEAGRITFTPADGFVGEVPAVTYTVADGNRTVVSAKLQITVSGPADGRGGGNGQTVGNDPVASGYGVNSPAGAGTVLASTGMSGSVGLAGLGALFLIGAGVGVSLLSRRRRRTDG